MQQHLCRRLEAMREGRIVWWRARRRRREKPDRDQQIQHCRKCLSLALRAA
jgi:hypothetical protein